MKSLSSKGRYRGRSNIHSKFKNVKTEVGADDRKPVNEMRKAEFSSSYFTFVLSFQENGLRSKGWKERQTKSGDIGQLRLAKSFLMDNSRRRPGGVFP